MPSGNEATWTGRFFTVRASHAQRASLQAEAERRGTTMSGLVRDALGAAGVPLWAASEQR